ncbi:hypothetical protein N9L92_01560 [Saprospiraceae bacterium]|nr:hypothetical protein [Saprospiraceae bacterium]
MFFSLHSAHAQRVIQPKLVEVDWKGIIYKKEWSIDLRLHENGAAIAYNSGTIKAYNKTNYYHLELGFTKDPREKTQSRISNIGGSGTFTLAKVNSVFNLRAGVGVKKYLSEKEKRRGVAVGYTYEIGPSIALLKPYFLDVIEIEVIDNEMRPVLNSIRFDGENAAQFLDVNSISGRSSFFRGFGDLSLRAGLQGKVGAHIAMGAFDEYVKAFETGLMFDVFPTEIPIFLETEEVDNTRYFVRVYINIQLGARKN